MMDRKNQNEHEILNMRGSRFSGEERARMAEQGISARRRNGGARQPRTASSATGGCGERHSRTASSDRGTRSTSVKKNAPAPKKEGSRNDRVRSSADKRKKEKKRQNNLLMAMLFLVAAAAICIACIFVLKINTVEVINGSDTYSDAGIAAKSGIEAGDSMLLINPEAAASAIATELPFIETATVERKWPDKIVITVEYAKTAMVIDTGSGYILLNNSCKVLDNDSPVFTEMAALVKGVEVVSAVPGQQIVFDGEADAEALRMLAAAVEESGIENVSCYDLTKITDVMLMVDRRIEIKLGTLAAAPDKLPFCLEVLRRTVEEDTKHAMVIDFTADGTAYARVKKDNHVNYEDETLPTEIPAEDVTGDEESTAAAEETTATFSVG